MIISASRRTDIPAFYGEWMLQRLREGEVLVPYPRDPVRIGRVELDQEKVDCIAFWTKNAAPMLGMLDEIDALGFRYYFSFTVTGYGADVERRVPNTEKAVDAFLHLSDRLGPERVDWRFDPIMVDAHHSVAWHLDAFGKLCRKLHGATERCIINLIKPYAHLHRIEEVDEDSIRKLGEGMAQVAAAERVPLCTCTAAWDFRDSGIEPGSCIDRKKVEAICGYPIDARKDGGQPKACRCIQSIDIGMYDTCDHGCTYCYAIADQRRLERNRADHDHSSPMLVGSPDPDAEVIDRTVPSCRNNQPALPLEY